MIAWSTPKDPGGSKEPARVTPLDIMTVILFPGVTEAEEEAEAS